MKILRLESTGSTNQKAMEQLAHTCPVSVIADSQSMGRGRGKNTWLSPSGNLYLSVADMLNPVQLPGLSVRTAVHLTRFLNPLLKDIALQIKWPNDLMVEDQKAGGILVESRIKGDSAATVVGLGLNLERAPLNASGAIGPHLQIRRRQLEEGAIAAIRQAMHDPVSPQLIPDLNRFSWLSPGDHIRFQEGEDTVNGIFIGYEPDLSLRVSVDRRERSFAGSLIHRIRKETP